MGHRWGQSYGYLNSPSMIIHNIPFINLENTFLVRARAIRPNKRGVCQNSMVSRFQACMFPFELRGASQSTFLASQSWFYLDRVLPVRVRV
jgi:hypothetical protein